MTYSASRLRRLRADAVALSTVTLGAVRDGDPVQGVGLVVWVEECWNSRTEPWAAVNLEVAGLIHHAWIFPSVMATLGGARLLPGVRLEFLARASVAETGVTLHLVEGRVAT